MEFETLLNVIFGTPPPPPPPPLPHPLLLTLGHQAAGAQGLLSSKPIGTQLGQIRRNGGWKRAETERVRD